MLRQPAPANNSGEKAVSGRPVIDPANWQASELASRSDWIFPLSDADIDLLVRVASGVRARIGDDVGALLATTQADFDLDGLAPVLDGVRTALQQGPGLALVRGLPVKELPLFDLAAIYWGIGLHLGRPLCNNSAGDMIGVVTDRQKVYAGETQRGYQTRDALEYHCDQCDVVGLLCLNQARRGGESRVVSAVAVYNELLRTRPDLVEVLSTPYCWSKNGEHDPDEPGYFPSPIFSFIDGRFCAALGSVHIERGHRVAGLSMTDLQREALHAAESVCQSLHAPMQFEPGDIQFLNNSVILHTRDRFEDWPEPDRKRRLWRLWLSAPATRPQMPYLVQWRNGVRVRSTVERILLDVE